MVWSSLAPKWPIIVPFCRIDLQKSSFSLISDSLSVWGCWGQQMSFFWNMVGETQIPKPPEATRNHNSIKLLIFLSLRADLLLSVHSDTPCSTFLFRVLNLKWKTLLVSIGPKWFGESITFMCGIQSHCTLEFPIKEDKILLILVYSLIYFSLLIHVLYWNFQYMYILDLMKTS